MADRTFRTGDTVEMTCQGRTMQARVDLASGNGKSLMLSFDAMIDGHVGMMPVLMGDDGVFRSIITDVEVTLKS